MRTLLPVAIALGAVLLVPPRAAYAQDPAVQETKPTVEAIISALDRTAENLQAFQARTELTPEDIQVVIVDEVLTPEAAAARSPRRWSGTRRR